MIGFVHAIGSALRSAASRSVVGALACALASCDGGAVVVDSLRPEACGASCAHCVDDDGQSIGTLAPPPPEVREPAARRTAEQRGGHHVLAEVRSHEGTPAAGVSVEVWHHSRGGRIELEATGTTDVDGIARIPFLGKGVYCFHAVHDEVGEAATRPVMLQLFGPHQDWPVELVLPESDVVIQRAGIAQVGVAQADGSPLANACVAIWRLDFFEEEPALSATGKTDEHGVLRLELERPGLYAVGVASESFGTASTSYAWFQPHGRRDDRLTDALTDADEWVPCDAHLRLGPLPDTGLRVPFDEHGFDAAVHATPNDAPACCRRWSRPAPVATSGW